MLTLHGTRLTLAVLADVHGNRWALEAVLRDLDHRGADVVVNLGDSLTGPLDPNGTAELLMARPLVSILGNDDRDLFGAEEAMSPAQRYTRGIVTASQLDWLRCLPDSAVIAEAVLACHGDLFDTPYLLEAISPAGVCLRATPDIEASVEEIAQSVILSGHSHVARTVWLPSGKLLVNPGSVGLPAYTMETPFPYAMEAGSPHARYALLCGTENGWQVEHIAVPYAIERAVEAASRQGRTDWAQWLATGRAC